MSVPIELTLNQKFEIERFNRAIDTTADLGQLRDIAKQLLQAWHTQKAATNWAMRQQIACSIGIPPQALSATTDSNQGAETNGGSLGKPNPLSPDVPRSAAVAWDAPETTQSDTPPDC